MFFISNKYGRIDPLMKEYILQTTNESIKKKLEHLNKNKYGKLLNFVTPSNNNEIYSITKNNTFKIVELFLFNSNLAGMISLIYVS